MNFSSLFVNRNSSILLQIEDLNPDFKSKLGGLPPAFVDEVTFNHKEELGDYAYMFTLSDEFSYFIDGKDLSVFIPKNYDDYSQHSIYPDFNLKCFIHESYNVLSKNTDLIYPAVKEGSLATLTKTSGSDEEYSYFIKVGSNPYLLQEEQYFLLRFRIKRV